MPSLFYFQALQPQKLQGAAPKRFTWENWLPIVLLFLMAAGIYFHMSIRQTYQKVVYVLDCSARMQIEEDGDTRFANCEGADQTAYSCPSATRNDDYCSGIVPGNSCALLC